MSNRVVHFEIGADDPAKLTDFYRKTFAWKINEWGDSGYFMVGTEKDRSVGAINGGILKRFENNQTINTIEVENLDAAIKDVADNGGRIVKPKASMPMDEMTMWWCYCSDPEGNVFGLMQMVSNAK